MNRGEHVVTNNAFGNQDRVLVVVAIPRHKRDHDVLAQCQFAQIGGRAIGNHFAFANLVTHFDQRALVDAGVLVRALEFTQTVDIHARITDFQIFGCADNDAVCVDLVNHTTTTGHNGRAGIACNDFFDPCANQRRFGPQQRHSLTHHVRAHQGAVGVIVFKERDQRGRNRHQLFRANVDQVHVFTRAEQVVAGFTAGHQIVFKTTLFIQMRVGLRHGVTHFFGRGHVLHFVRYLRIDNLAIRGFDKAVFVHTRKGGQRVDQTNVRTLGRFNRTHAAIVGWMHIAHLETGTFTGQTTWPKCGQAAFVRHFRQRVGLVHELRQLRRAEEFANRSRSRFGVDQILRHHRVDFDRRHTFLDRALHAQQTNAVLVFHQLANGPNTTIAKVVNIIDLTLAVAQFNQRLDAGNDIFAAQGALGIFGIQIQTHVHFHAANGGQIVTLAIKEQRIEQGRCGFNGGWLAGAHHTIDVHQRGVATHVFVDGQRVADVGANIDVVDIQNRNLGDTGIQQLLQGAANDFTLFVQLLRQLVAGFDVNRTGFFVDDVLGNEFADNLVKGHQQFGNFAFVNQLFHSARGNLFTRFGNHLAGFGVHQIKGRTRAAHTLGEELGDPTLVLLQLVLNRVVIGIHDAFLVQTQRIQQGGDRQLAATVDAGKNDVFGIEFEIQPRTAIGNDTAGEQQFARRMGFTLVVVKEHTGRAVHLRNDNTFGAVHDKCAVRSHQRHVTHKHVLFFDVLDRFRASIFVNIKYDQTQGNLQRG